MKRRYCLLASLFLLLAGLLGSGAAPASAQEKAYWAEQFNQTVTVEEGGSLLVRERVTYAFVGEPFTYIFREIPTDYTDGVTILETRLDGERLRAGTGPGQVEIGGEDPIRITWHMAPTVDQSRTVELVYRMAGVVRQTSDADLLRYQILPDDYDFFVESSENRFSYPGNTALVRDPVITAGQAMIRAEGQEVVVAGSGYEAGDPLVVELGFRPSTIVAEPPAWQAQRQRQAALAPLWLALGLAVLLAGAAALFLFWHRYRPAAATAPDGPLYEPPTALAPALAGTLSGSGLKPEWPQALATLFSLADRGILVLEERDEKKWFRSQDFDVVLKQAPGTDLDPHEQRLLDLLFETKEGRGDSVKLSELSRRISSKRWKAYQEAVQAEMKAAGLLDQERQQAKRRLGVAGFVLLLASVAVLFLALAWGPWTLAVSFGLLGVAMATLIGAAAFRPLSQEGARLASRWEPFRDYLRGVSKGKAAATRPDLFQLYLPYAAAFDLLSPWARHFEKEEGTALPPWFHAVSTAPGDHMAAFVAMSAAASSSGGTAAGAAGAGAAGGGAAGAG